MRKTMANGRGDRKDGLRWTAVLAVWGLLTLLLTGCAGERKSAPEGAADAAVSTRADGVAVPTDASGTPEPTTASAAATEESAAPDAGTTGPQTPDDATPVLPLETTTSSSAAALPSRTVDGTTTSSSVSPPAAGTTEQSPLPTLPSEGITLPFIPA